MISMGQTNDARREHIINLSFWRMSGITYSTCHEKYLCQMKPNIDVQVAAMESQINP
jgi:hypothetical protein